MTPAESVLRCHWLESVLQCHWLADVLVRLSTRPNSVTVPGLKADGCRPPCSGHTPDPEAWLGCPSHCPQGRSGLAPPQLLAKVELHLAPGQGSGLESVLPVPGHTGQCHTGQCHQGRMQFWPARLLRDRLGPDALVPRAEAFALPLTRPGWSLVWRLGWPVDHVHSTTVPGTATHHAPKNMERLHMSRHSIPQDTASPC